MSSGVVGRFAPTPSGRMHLGNVYAAMMAYLSAKSKGGSFLVRIEDLDRERSYKDIADETIADLKRLGFEIDGEILYQSERFEIYREYEQILRDKGLLYPCFCSRAELHAATAPHASDGSYVYDGKCRNLTEQEIEQKSATRRPCLRMRVPDETVELTDGICGKYSQNLARDCGDFIIKRSDGVFAYQLAVVVDDALSGVTEVVRGDDLLSSTPRQIWLQRTLGFNTPSYKHLPLLTAADGRRLSKRDGDTLAYALEHNTPEQIIGDLAFRAGLTRTPDPISLKDLLSIYSE